MNSIFHKPFLNPPESIFKLCRQQKSEQRKLVCVSCGKPAEPQRKLCVDCKHELEAERGE
jgi:predicted amidophosphoribosyltransferase